MAEARGRPEILFPLFAELEGLDGIGPKTAKNYKGLGIETPKDLLLTLPVGGINRTRRATINGADLPATLTVEIVVGPHRKPALKGRPYRVHVTDAETSFDLVFFHARGDYLDRLLPTGARRVISGKVELFDGIAQMVHPDHVVPPAEAESIPAFEPVYPLTSGVTQRGIVKAVASALPRAPYLGE